MSKSKSNPIVPVACAFGLAALVILSTSKKKTTVGVSRVGKTFRFKASFTPPTFKPPPRPVYTPPAATPRTPPPMRAVIKRSTPVFTATKFSPSKVQTITQAVKTPPPLSSTPPSAPAPSTSAIASLIRKNAATATPPGMSQAAAAPMGGSILSKLARIMQQKKINPQHFQPGGVLYNPNYPRPAAPGGMSAVAPSQFAASRFDSPGGYDYDPFAGGSPGPAGPSGPAYDPRFDDAGPEYDPRLDGPQAGESDYEEEGFDEEESEVDEENAPEEEEYAEQEEDEGSDEEASDASEEETFEEDERA